YRYVAGLVGNPFGKAVYSVPLTKRYFHATGSLHASQRNYYEILGISKDASRDEIRKAFHELAKKYHPDTNENTPSAKRKFQEIRDAYETLRDSEKRAQYDLSLNMGSGYARRDSGGRGSEDVHYDFADAEAFRQAYRTHFSDSFHKIFSEIFQDEVDNFAADIQQQKVAQNSCLLMHTSPVIHAVTIPPFSATCSTCKGSGRVITEKCGKCKGLGVLEGVKEVEVTIP
ncbi:Chaperone protein dnaJ 1 mitochondrial, partial [Bienertia sinuspersici]